MDILVSVIVPVYNNVKDLKRCIDSIRGQTYNNLQIILVDDGSTDGSENICDEYLEIDQRIEVLHKKNEGVSLARNAGIDKARGEKIIFVDSDDYIAEDYVEKLLEYSSKDLVICGYVTINREGRQANAVSKKYLEKEEILKSLTEKSEMRFYSAPYLKLFDSKIIRDNNIRFNENMDYGEDSCFVYEYISNINNLQFISNLGYYNNVSREDSLSRRKRKNAWMEMYEVFKTAYKLYSSNSHKYNKQITAMFLKSAKTALNCAIISDISQEEFVELCKSITGVNEFKETRLSLMRLYDMLILFLLKCKRYKILWKIMKIK